MIKKITELLADEENFLVFLFLVYVIALTHLIGYFAIGWAWGG